VSSQAGLNSPLSLWLAVLSQSAVHPAATLARAALQQSRAV
jgi:hypothetical protein